jgi:hypothetical protein
MLFFRRILRKNELTPDGSAGAERRGLPRYTVNAAFPVRSGLTVGETAEARLSRGGSRAPRQVACRLVDCSEGGLRVQLQAGTRLSASDLCDLSLHVEEFRLRLPCRVTNARELPAGWIFGLRLEVADPEAWAAYYQFLEVVALGASLRRHRLSERPGESGYIEEVYVNNRPARLSVWRHPSSRELVAIEFQLKNYLVRAVTGGAVEYLSGPANRAARSQRAEEIERLFKWVVWNLPPLVPDDVQEFLKKSAA